MKNSKIKNGIRYIYYYLLGRMILVFHYDKKRFISGRWFQGDNYGNFTAPGWRILVQDYLACKKMKINQNIPWPVSPRITVVNPDNIVFDADDLNNFQGFGNYYQAIGKILIGKGTYIAANVGIITANHDVLNLDQHLPGKDVVLGENCWVGMNSVILPGVELGEHTIVGAGSVVTKSFPEGHQIIAGNPAKIIRKI